MKQPTSLDGKARTFLRGLGHHRRPIVLLGKGGLTDAIVAATEIALADHELVKVKLGEHTDGDREDVSTALAAATKSELVGQIGRTFLLYRRHPDKPRIALPNAPKPKAARALGRKQRATGLTKKR